MDPGRILACTVSLIIVLSLAPGPLGAAGQPATCPDLSDAQRQGSVLAPGPTGSTPVTTAAYGLLMPLAEGTEALGAVNGLDAHIFDLGCEVDSLSACVEHRGGDLGDPDLHARFYDSTFQQVGSGEGPADPLDSIECVEQPVDVEVVPAGTRYIEISSPETVPGASAPAVDQLGPAWAAFTLILSS